MKLIVAQILPWTDYCRILESLISSNRQPSNSRQGDRSINLLFSENSFSALRILFFATSNGDAELIASDGGEDKAQIMISDGVASATSIEISARSSMGANSRFFSEN